MDSDLRNVIFLIKPVLVIVRLMFHAASLAISGKQMMI